MAKQGWVAFFRNAMVGFYRLEALRQLSLLLGLSISVALGVAVVFWAKTPDYRTLFSSLTTSVSAEVVQVLEQSHVPYQFDASSGTIRVPTDRLNSARLTLAKAGVPKKTAVGFDELSGMQSIGASRLVESARYWHALEMELARTISSFENVRTARVHLAANKSSVYLSDTRKPSASVLIDLLPGNQLAKEQVEAIEQLVAASIQGLDAKGVTVVDSQGRLLSDHSGEMSRTRAEFEYQHNLENLYAKHIEDILTPMLGANKVRAQVAAQMDFTSSEQTQEEFNPLNSAIRSENTVNVKSATDPNALLNPVAPHLDAQGNETKVSQLQTMRQFEISRNVSHSRAPMGVVKRLTVAVIVDDHAQTDATTGVVHRRKLTFDEISQVTALVKNVVGFSASRGDTVSVVNTSFAEPVKIMPPAPPKFWEQSAFWMLLKGLLAGGFLLLFVLLVLRPVLLRLASQSPVEPFQAESGVATSPGQVTITNAELDRLRQQGQWTRLKQMASDDPERIAKLMRTWVGDE